MITVTTLLAKIDAFLGEAGIAETTFGKRAVNDGKLVPRLRAGAGITIATVDRVDTYIASQRKVKPPKRTRSAA